MAGRDASDYLTVISGYCREGRLDRAVGVLAHIRSASSCRPDAATYNALIYACAASDRYDSGRIMLEELVGVGGPPTRHAGVGHETSRGRISRQSEQLLETLSQNHSITPDRPSIQPGPEFKLHFHVDHLWLNSSCASIVRASVQS